MDWIRLRWRPVLLTVVIITCVGCDQATKKYAVKHLTWTHENPQSYFGDTFRIQYAENRGAFLSLGADWTPRMRFLLFALAPGLALPIFAILMLLNRDLAPLTVVALTLIIAGGVGNLIDRMTTADAVVIDFLNVGIGWLRTGVFNIADMAITAGFVLLLPHVLRKDERPVIAAKS